MAITKKEWWNDYRQKSNKILLGAGLITILFTSILFYFIDNSVFECLWVILYGIILYSVYIGTINFLFLLFEFADRQLGSEMNLNEKQPMSNYVIYIAIVIPLFYPIFLFHVILK